MAGRVLLVFLLLNFPLYGVKRRFQLGQGDCHAILTEFQVPICVKDDIKRMDDSRDSFGTRCPIFGDSHNSPIIDFDGGGGVTPYPRR